MSTDTAAPKFIVLEKSLIGNRIHEPGEEVTLPVGTLPAENLQAICDAGRALKEEYTTSNAARVAKMRAENSESAVGDPATFAKLLAEANAENHTKIADAVAEGIARGIGKLIASGALAAPAAAAKGGKGGKTSPDGDLA